MVLLQRFERIVQLAGFHSEAPDVDREDLHPFAARDIHQALPKKVRILFDDAHYSEATFHAAKFFDKKVASLAELTETGASLMQKAFSEKAPKIRVNNLIQETDVNEQKGYMSLFVGLVWAIRNPRGHEFDIGDEQSLCLDHLSFMSMLMRRLEAAGYLFS